MQRRTSGAGWRLTWIPDIERLREREIAPSVYYLLCKPTKVGYIGSAKDLWHRMKYHFSNLGINKHPNHKLQAAFNKYGVDQFTWGVIETCHEELLGEREQYWIDRYPPERLFNIRRKVDRIYPIVTITEQDARRAFCGLKFVRNLTAQRLISQVGVSARFLCRRNMPGLSRLIYASLAGGAGICWAVHHKIKSNGLPVSAAWEGKSLALMAIATKAPPKRVVTLKAGAGNARQGRRRIITIQLPSAGKTSLKKSTRRRGLTSYRYSMFCKTPQFRIRTASKRAGRK